MSPEKKDSSSLTIIIGLILIFAIGAITFFRPSNSLKKQTDSVSIEKEEKKPGREISPEALMEKIKSKENLIIIDVRDREEFLKEHILDSKNIPLSEIQQNLSSLNKNESYVLVDSLGERPVSNLASDFFPDNGFSSVSFLSGGLGDWKSKFYPLITNGDPTSFSDQAKVSYIKTEDLKNMLIKKEDIFLIDLRKSGAFSEGHIPGATNIFLDDLEKKRTEIPSGKKIILYDNDGLWAMKGAVRLFDAGIFNVFALSDGLDAWKKQGYEMAK